MKSSSHSWVFKFLRFPLQASATNDISEPFPWLYYIVKLVELCSASECFYAIQLFFTKVSLFSKSVCLNSAKCLSRHIYSPLTNKCHILSFGSSGLNCEFIRRECGFSTNSKISLVSSGNELILIMKISATNFCRFRYFTDFDIKIVLFGHNGLNQ